MVKTKKQTGSKDAFIVAPTDQTGLFSLVWKMKENSEVMFAKVNQTKPHAECLLWDRKLIMIFTVDIFMFTTMDHDFKQIFAAELLIKKTV